MVMIDVDVNNGDADDSDVDNRDSGGISRLRVKRPRLIDPLIQCMHACNQSRLANVQSLES